MLIRVYMGSWNKFSLVAQVFLILELLVLRSSVICIRLYDVVWFMESRFNVSFLRSRLPTEGQRITNVAYIDRRHRRSFIKASGC